VSGPTTSPLRAGLAIATTAAIATGALALAAPAASAEGCTWQRHSKPVIKQLRRHGRLQRVKRVKHWWACDAQPAPATPTPQPAPPALPANPALPVEEDDPSLAHLSVKALEWKYTLSHAEVDAGETIVELNNEGEDAHNLWLQREGSSEPPIAVPEASAKKRTTARLTLEPGTYHLYCSLFEHEAKGMHATLVVLDSD
jgi:plastocyanin